MLICVLKKKETGLSLFYSALEKLLKEEMIRMLVEKLINVIIFYALFSLHLLAIISSSHERDQKSLTISNHALTYKFKCFTVQQLSHFCLAASFVS